MPSKTFVVFKVSAKEPGESKKLAESLRKLKSAQVKDVKSEPIGFGIEVIKVGVLVDEKDEQAIEKTLNEIKQNKMVETVEIDAMTLV